VPIKGEGGVLTAYQHAQLMAGIPLTRPPSAPVAAPTAVTLSQPTLVPTAVAAIQPTVVPTTAATVAPTLVTQAPAQPTEVKIADDAFSPKTIGVAVGTTLVWTRSGTHPHTVTADDGSFDSGLLRGTDQFQRTFDAAGRVCLLLRWAWWSRRDRDERRDHGQVELRTHQALRRCRLRAKIIFVDIARAVVQRRITLGKEKTGPIGAHSGRAWHRSARVGSLGVGRGGWAPHAGHGLTG